VELIAALKKQDGFFTLVVLWRTVRTKKNGKEMPEAKFLAAGCSMAYS
jgi:hypothetical protein